MGGRHSGPGLEPAGEEDSPEVSVDHDLGISRRLCLTFIGKLSILQGPLRRMFRRGQFFKNLVKQLVWALSLIRSFDRKSRVACINEQSSSLARRSLVFFEEFDPGSD